MSFEIKGYASQIKKQKARTKSKSKSI